MRAELTAADLRTALSIVREVTAAQSLADFRRIVPAAILAAVPGTLAGYNEIDAASGESYVAYSPSDAVPDALAQRFALYALEHPTLRHMARTGDGSAVSISDVVPRGQYRASRLYLELFADMQVEDQIVIGLPAPQPLIIGAPINRDSWGFTARERAILDELRPHLAQAHATAAIRDALAAAVASRDAALERTGNGVIRLEHGALVDASPLARRWLERGLLDGGGSLADDLRSWYVRERSRLDDDASAPELAGPFVVRHDGASATVRLVDADTILVQERDSAGPTEADLRRLGLSSAEAHVLLLLVMGRSTEQIAAALFITTGTVRKHVQRILRKLGVHSRSAAVAFALSSRQ